ncbi:MAG TPA: hypothetical protein ENH72_12600 [Pseudomonas sabulinigri]|mgnify:CR=1 FL=1|uniref:Uncharacterized protein n=1 Tax=marine sediment metagenome TaxID=412755 RepID=A0A0F9VT10_9ZZZZ|nr:hypothetical protein [Halopseudomonas sabulinigri]HEC52243.1 hypothetical protein [Halopseudomonas sabulinigri]
MKRQQLIEKIDVQDRKLSLRAEVMSAVTQHTQLSLGQVNPAWLVGAGALAGGLVGRMGIGRTYTLGMAGLRLFPMVQNAFNLGRSFGEQG